MDWRSMRSPSGCSCSARNLDKDGGENVVMLKKEEKWENEVGKDDTLDDLDIDMDGLFDR